MTLKNWTKPINLYFLTSSRNIAALVFFISLASLSYALIAEHFWDVKPCILCIYQRYVMSGLIGSSLIGWLIKKKFFIGIYILVSLAGLSISGYHVGVEQHWWKGPMACSSNSLKIDTKASKADQIRAFRAKIKQQTTTVVRCDDINWRIVGVSATIWSFILYLGLVSFLSISFFCKKQKVC